MAKCTSKQTDGRPPVNPIELSPIHEGVLNHIAHQIHKLAKSKGWHPKGEKDDFYIAKTCANIHGEVSEFFEAHRKDELNDLCDKAVQMSAVGIEPLTCAEEELADIIIRALDTAGRLGVDIGKAVQRKHEYNSTRAHRHGGKKA